MSDPLNPAIFRHPSHISSQDKEKLLGQRPVTIWLSGLSGAGKSTIAFALERHLIASGKACCVLDGDNIRHGLCSDLGFSEEDRTENIRRVAEVARLMNDAGLIVISAFISPYRKDRAMAQEIIGPDKFMETYISTPLAICESRDPKGLYKRARAGLLPAFTGISAPYEAPDSPALVLDTKQIGIDDCLAKIMEALTPFMADNPPK